MLSHDASFSRWPALVVVACVQLCGAAVCNAASPPDDPTAILAREIKNSPRPDLAAADRLYKQLKDEEQARATPPISSQADFSALIKKTRFPSAEPEGQYPSFELMPADRAARFGLPEGLTVDYLWFPADKDELLFVVPIRTLTTQEEGTVENKLSNHPVFAPETVARLQAANPDRDSAFFAVKMIPSGLQDGMQVERPMLILVVVMPNRSPSPQLVDAVGVKILTILGATQNLWR